MLETNARILAPGPNIALPVRTVRVQGTTNTPELREKVCYRLRQEAGLIAVPCQERRGMLLVATDTPLSMRRLHVDEWELTLSDQDETKLLTLYTPEGRQLLPELVERMVTHAIEQKGQWWSFDSLRYWYEKRPFQIEENVEAYRRFAVSVLPLDGVGIGVAIDVETAFFTRDTVAYFFDPRVPGEEKRRRQDRFRQLTRRQNGQHGTLLYDNGIHQLKCYFESLSRDTCGNTRPQRVRGKEYRSLVDYYQNINPELKVRHDTPVGFVSFPNLDYPQPVAADRLWIRVMNDALPLSLVNVDKIPPHLRRPMLEAFWHALGDLSFSQIRRLVAYPDNSRHVIQEGAVLQRSVTAAGEGEHSLERKGNGYIDRSRYAGNGVRSASLPVPATLQFSEAEAFLSPDQDAATTGVHSDLSPGRFLPGFWRPAATRVRSIPFPILHFGNDQTLEPPRETSALTYREHFKRRMSLLGEAGVYHFPPLMGRLLVAPYPASSGLCQATEEMMSGLCERLEYVTGRPFEYRVLPYDDLETGVAELGREKMPGTAVFVLNDEVEAYAEVALGLPQWKIKRVTQDTLRKKYRDLTQGVRPARGGMPDKLRGQRSWASFLRMMALDVLQVMDGVPFRLDRAGNFEAQLVIDVSYDRRYYALSLLIAREKKKRPDFFLVSDVWQKPDMKHETINGRLLYDDIVKFVSRWIIPGKDTPLASLLISRDGRLVGDERDAIERATLELKKRGCLAAEARMEVAELHKATEMHLRLWEVDAHNSVTNVLEATALRLTSTMEVLTTTGAGTLTQGTAEPLLIVAPDGCEAIGEITDSLGASAHLNWSSPEVAQRLPVPFKRTDEVLKARAEQQIRRIS